MKRLFKLLTIAAVAGMAASCVMVDGDFDGYYLGGADIDRHIDNISVEWSDGLVQVRYHNKPFISFDEEGAGRQMCYCVTGNSLDIRFAKSHSFSSTPKELFLYLPNGKTFHNVDIESVAADVDMDIDADHVRVETVSGEVYYSTMITPVDVDIETVSGKVTIALPAVTAFSLDYDTISGGIYSEYRLSQADGLYWYGYNGARIDVETVSGNLDIIVNRD